MSYLEKSFELSDADDFRRRALQWAFQFSHTTFFSDSNVAFPYKGFSTILFAGLYKQVAFTQGQCFEDLFLHYSTTRNWLTGYFSYDLKNEIEELYSNKSDFLGFNDCCFYQPQFILHISDSNVIILSIAAPPEQLFKEITQTPLMKIVGSSITMQSRIPRDQYINIVDALKRHILKGDVYELNFCMEFYKENVVINALDVYWQLVEKSPSPFSVFQKINDTFLLCSSPERFLKKASNKLISQPIKGTAARYNDPFLDFQSKNDLVNSEKEKAENLMIVDLVRNDLAKSSLTGSIEVEELFGIYTFSQVHQMISTITSQISPEVNFAQAIKNAFPMGSMTGAPKIKAMELIEQYEQSKRGLYSGAVGYINPKGDFDFNVVIRSLLYNSTNQYLSLQVGSAITSDSIPEKEYDECMLKAKALMEVLASG